MKKYCIILLITGFALVFLWLQNKEGRLIKRLVEIRNADSFSSLKITKENYFLMRCDFAITERNYPNLDYVKLGRPRRFNAARNLKTSDVGHNWRGFETKSGKVVLESFYCYIPSPKYQASPQEVVWYYIRDKELRKEGMARMERIKTINVEALKLPWLKEDK